MQNHHQMPLTLQMRRMYPIAISPILFIDDGCGHKGLGTPPPSLAPPFGC